MTSILTGIVARVSCRLSWILNRMSLRRARHTVDKQLWPSEYPELRLVLYVCPSTIAAARPRSRLSIQYQALSIRVRMAPWA